MTAAGLSSFSARSVAQFQQHSVTHASVIRWGARVMTNICLIRPHTPAHAAARKPLCVSRLPYTKSRELCFGFFFVCYTQYYTILNCNNVLTEMQGEEQEE